MVVEVRMGITRVGRVERREKRFIDLRLELKMGGLGRILSTTGGWVGNGGDDGVGGGAGP